MDTTKQHIDPPLVASIHLVINRFNFFLPCVGHIGTYGAVSDTCGQGGGVVEPYMKLVVAQRRVNGLDIDYFNR